MPAQAVRQAVRFRQMAGKVLACRLLLFDQQTPRRRPQGATAGSCNSLVPLGLMGACRARGGRRLRGLGCELPCGSSARVSSELLLIDVFNRNRASTALVHALVASFGVDQVFPYWEPRIPCDENTCQNPRVPAIIVCSPLGLGEGGAFGGTETRIWVDVSVSSRNSRIARVPGICSDADRISPSGSNSGAFSIAESCELSRNPCFPATLRRLPILCSSGLILERPRSRGYFQVLQVKGVSCERERYSQVV